MLEEYQDLLDRHPVFDKQSRYSAELTDIVRDQTQPLTSGMPRYLIVICSNTLTSDFQIGNDPATVYGGMRIESQHFQPGEKALHNRQVGIRFHRFFNTFDQFHDRNGADAQLSVAAAEMLANNGGTILDGVNAGAGVEHVFKYQKPSRSCSGG